MLLFQLNLLSLPKKNKLQTLTRYLFTKELLEIVIFTVAILAIAHLFGWLILTETLQDLTNTTLMINRGSHDQQEPTKQMNRLVNKITAAADGYVPLTPKLLEIITLVPNDIRLNALTLSRDDNTLLLSGTAKTREALINFRNTLSNVPWLKTVPTPPSELLLKENVSFTLRAMLQDFMPLPLSPTNPSPNESKPKE